MTNDYQLIDAEAQHRAHPDTFELPEAEWFEVIEPGWLIKIGVCHPAQPGESIWCRIRHVTESGFRVVVNQQLFCSDLHGIDYGDALTVERRHILAVEPPQLDARKPAWVQ